MKHDDSNDSSRPVWPSIVAGIVLAALVGLGTWLTTSLLHSSDSVTGESSELSASQHVEHLVRVLRISATTDTTSVNIETIPEAAAGSEPVTCGSHYAHGLDRSVVQLHAIDRFSTIAGSRAVDTDQWRTQQGQADDGTAALQRLFPADCLPQLPVTFVLPDRFRSAEGISMQHMLKVSDTLVDEWTQLYLLAETPDEQDVALAGLWQVIQWEATWQPGRSPFAFTS